MALGIFRKLTKRGEQHVATSNVPDEQQNHPSRLQPASGTPSNQVTAANASAFFRQGEGIFQKPSISSLHQTRSKHADATVEGVQDAEDSVGTKRKQAKAAFKKVVNKATFNALFRRQASTKDDSSNNTAVSSETASQGELLPSDFGSSLSSSLSSTKAFDFIGKAQPQTVVTTHNISVHPLDLSLPRTRATSGSFFAGHDRELERDTLRKSSAYTRQTRQSSTFTFASDRYEEQETPSKTTSSSAEIGAAKKIAHSANHHTHSHGSTSSSHYAAQTSQSASLTGETSDAEDVADEEASDDEIILTSKRPEVEKDEGYTHMPGPVELPQKLGTHGKEPAEEVVSAADAVPKALQGLPAAVRDGGTADLAALAAQRAAKPSRFAAYFADKEHTSVPSKHEEDVSDRTGDAPKDASRSDRGVPGPQSKIRKRKPTPLGLDSLLSNDACGHPLAPNEEASVGLGSSGDISSQHNLKPQRPRDLPIAPLAPSDLRELVQKQDYAHPVAARSKHGKLTGRDANTIQRKRPGTPYAHGKAEKKLLARGSPAHFDPDESMVVNAPASPQLLDLPHEGLPQQPYDGKARAAVLNTPLPADPPQPQDLQTELEKAGAQDFEGFDGFVRQNACGEATSSSSGSSGENEGPQPRLTQIRGIINTIGEQDLPQRTASRLTRRSRSAETLHTVASAETSFSAGRQQIVEEIARDVQYEGRYQSLRPTANHRNWETAGTGPATDPRRIIPENLHLITTPPRHSANPRKNADSWETEDEEYRHRRARFVQLDRPWTPRPRSARRDQFAELYTKVSKFDPHKPSPTHTPTIYDSSSSEGGPVIDHRMTGAGIPLRKTDDTVVYSPTLNLEWDQQIKAWLDSQETDIERSKRLQLLFGQRHKYGLSTREIWPDDAIHQAKIDGGHWDDNDTGSNDDEDDPARKHWHRTFTLAKMEGDFEVFDRENEFEIRAFIQHHQISSMNHIFPQWIKHPIPRRPWQEAELAAAKDRWEDQLRPTTPPVLVDLNAHERDIHISPNGGVYQQRRVPDRFRDELLQVTAAGYEVKLPRGFYEHELQEQEHLQTHGRTEPLPERLGQHAEQVAPGVTMHEAPVSAQMQAEHDAVRDTLINSREVIAELEALRNGQRDEQEQRRWLAHGGRVTPPDPYDDRLSRHGTVSPESVDENLGSVYGEGSEYEDASHYTNTTGYDDDHWLGARTRPPPGLEQQQQGAFGPDFYTRMLSGEHDDHTDHGEGVAYGAGEHDLPRPQPLPIGTGRPLPQQLRQQREIVYPDIRRPVSQPGIRKDSPYPAQLLQAQQATQASGATQALRHPQPQPQQTMPIYRPLPRTRQNIRRDSPYPQQILQQAAAPRPQQMYHRRSIHAQQPTTEQPSASGHVKVYSQQPTSSGAQAVPTSTAPAQQATGSTYVPPRSGIGHVQVFNPHPIFANAMAAREVSEASAAPQDLTETDQHDARDSCPHDDAQDGEESSLSSAGTDEAETVIYRSPLVSPRPLGEQILDPEGEGFEGGDEIWAEESLADGNFAEESFADGEYDDRNHYAAQAGVAVDGRMRRQNLMAPPPPPSQQQRLFQEEWEEQVQRGGRRERLSALLRRRLGVGRWL